MKCSCGGGLLGGCLLVGLLGGSLLGDLLGDLLVGLLGDDLLVGLGDLGCCCFLCYCACYRK